MPTTQFATRPAGAKAHPKRTRALIQIRDLDGAAALHALRQRALDERVDLAVEHGRRVRALRAGAQVLYELVGLQHIGADLVAPADLRLARGLGTRLLLALLQLQIVEARFQHAPRDGAVLDLRALLLARHRDAGRQVRDAHRGIGRVDVLAPRARGAIGIDAALALVDLDVDVVVDDGVHPYRGKACVPARIRVVGRDAHQPVDARFGLEPAVGVLALDLERRRLEARLFARALLDQAHLIAALLRPAHVHARQHGGPVLALGAPGACMHLDIAVVGVGLARQQRLDRAPLRLLVELLE